MDSARAAVRRPVDERRASAVGRSARLDMVFGCRRGRTSLVHAYAEPPLRIGRTIDVCGSAHAILVCAGPGVFGGDRLEMRIRVETGARVALMSQSALQVHPAGETAGLKARIASPSDREETEPAVLESRYDVESGAELDCFWDPVIPFARARLIQRTDLHVARGSRFFWSDALMSGRAGRGESWQFDELAHELRLSLDGGLAYLERYRVIPGRDDPRRTWIAGAGHYAGTTLVHHEDATSSRAAEIQRRLDDIEGLRAGADCVGDRLLVGRTLASHGPCFAAARAVFRHAFSLPALRR